MVRAVVDGAYESGDMIWRGRATEVLVQLLVRRGSVDDQHEAQAAMDRLVAVPTDPGFVLHELPCCVRRRCSALARGDEDGHRNFGNNIAPWQQPLATTLSRPPPTRLSLLLNVIRRAGNI